MAFTTFTAGTTIKSAEINENFNLKANLASPTFTGTLTGSIITAPTIIGTTITATSLVTTTLTASSIQTTTLTSSSIVGTTITATTFVANDNIIMASGKGISFAANSNGAGMTSEVLDDYETGTFTPTVFGRTVAGVATYTTQIGTYTKIGPLVFVRMTLNITAHTGSGAIGFGGLPFTSRTGPSQNCPITIGYVTNLAWTAANIPFAYTDDGATTISMGTMPTGGGAAGSVGLDSIFEIIISGCYHV